MACGIEHPEVAIDNNPAERALRGPVVGRKNYYGSGALWSGTLAAALFSLFGTLRFHTCYCCPPQVARTIARLHRWAYGLAHDAVWVHLYGGSRLDAEVAGGALVLTQETDYPWDGAVVITLQEAPAEPFCLEAVDLSEGAPLDEIHLPRDFAPVAHYEPDLLGGIAVLEGTAIRAKSPPWQHELYRRGASADRVPVPIRMIPYFAWHNRGNHAMAVWLPLA